jgi:hypothetical protein
VKDAIKTIEDFKDSAESNDVIEYNWALAAFAHWTAIEARPWALFITFGVFIQCDY